MHCDIHTQRQQATLKTGTLMKFLKILPLFFCLLLGTSKLTYALPTSSPAIPPQLVPWKSWVLYGHEDRTCPSLFNDGAIHKCIWPSRLTLKVKSSEGHFSQQWFIFKKGFVPLPGSGTLWPVDITADGESLPVIEKNGRPVIYLPPGKHFVSGRIQWHKIPEMIPVPPECGLISLTVEGKEIPPVLDTKGRLWLQKKPNTLALEDKLDLHAFRLVEDLIPMRVVTLLRLNIAGHPREITVKGTLLKGAVAMQIKSPLPARLSPDGILLIQGRPGQWEIRVKSYLKGHIKALLPVPFIGNQEIWSLKTHNQIRMVKIKGIPSINPRQTNLPPEWKRYTAYLINPDSKIVFQELRRGDPTPTPDQLNLMRSWWLDFSGKGFTIQDKITGTIRRSWRLTLNPPERLGHVSIDGKDQLITHIGKTERAGVELRKGNLRMTADMRLEGFPRTIPAIGWDHDFHTVSEVLNLPPGWRLLGMTGPDTVSGTWFEKWTLLDLFLVVILTMIIARLFGIKWAILAFITLVLTYHERGAPRIVWLSVLIPIALLRFLPRSWLLSLIKLWRIGAVVALIVISLPFMVHQVRIGFYPQLEQIPSWGPSPQAELLHRLRKPRRKRKKPYAGKSLSGLKISESKKFYSTNQTLRGKRITVHPQAFETQDAVFSYDPNAQIQTGPGIPTWKWRQIPIKWNGPVEKTQNLQLWLLSPKVNLFLALIRVLLTAWLIYLCTGLRNFRKNHPFKSLWLACALFITMLLPPLMPLTASAEFPPPSMLNELQKRLLKSPKCLPDCASNPKMDLFVTSDSLRILLQIHAAIDTAVPLPGNLRTWQPFHILLDQKPAKGLFRDSDGRLWIYCSQGIHQVVMTGSISKIRSFQLPFTLMPRSAKISAKGWQVQGINENGQVLSTLQFTREEKKDTVRKPFAWTEQIPPFFHVTRTLSLGLQWNTFTSVERLTPVGVPYVVQVPLIKGESVISEGFEVRNGKITLSFKPETSILHWRSHLVQAANLHITSPANVPWTETWVLDASPIWHCELSGISVIHHQNTKGYWQPTWKPWPGEEINIKVTRPPAIPGEIFTINRIGVKLDKGKRFNRILLSLNVKASQGKQHPLRLPSQAKLQKVTIDGKTQPIQIRNRRLILPLHPGPQAIQIAWLQPTSSSTMTQLPKIDIGRNTVNATLTYKIPPNRWILWTHGPALGPAVLFWSYLVVILLGAIALGKISWTPLKTRHWILLGLGMTQVHPLITLMIVGWLLTLGIRKKEPPVQGALRFDLSQILLIFWSIAALIGLYLAIKKGLLGIPEMQISGNGSNSGWLHWTQDRTAPVLPQPWVLSLPLLAYRVLMLLWALWLAYSLIRWLRWGWHCFNEGGGWKKLLLRSNRKLKVKRPSPPS